MTEAEWLACDDPELLLVHLFGKVSDRKCRLLACACVRDDSFVPDQFGCSTAVMTAERMSDGTASEEERSAAITVMELAANEASNAWSYLVEAAAATLLPIGIEAAGLTLDRLDCFNSELGLPSRVWPVALLRCIFGNPFRPITFDPSWRTEAVTALAQGIYADRAFDRLPVLADALQETGCDNDDVLSHCRGDGPHSRGCWVVDLLLGKA